MAINSAPSLSQYLEVSWKAFHCVEQESKDNKSRKYKYEKVKNAKASSKI